MNEDYKFDTNVYYHMTPKFTYYDIEYELGVIETAQQRHLRETKKNLHTETAVVFDGVLEAL